MLGITRPKQDKAWAVYGKHPVTKDYFMLGTDTPIFKAFSSWVENGYNALTQEAGSTIRSFRFWAKGLDKGTLISGVVRDSSDSMGRPFPMLTIGMGQVKGLKRYWEKALLVCEPMWYEIERFSAKHFSDIRQMEESLLDISFPNGDWQALEDETDVSVEEETQMKFLSTELQALEQNKEIIITLNNFPQTDQMEAARQTHYILKGMSKDVPNAVFLGGIPEKSCMAIYKRPLQINDFLNLWTFG